MTDVLTFQSAVGRHILMVDGSRIYDVAPSDWERIRAGSITLPDEIVRPGFVGDRPPEPPPLRALSLNVAQACNLACRYCYADHGRFGESPQMMSEATAMRAVALLIDEAEPGGSAVLGFMGGEPLANRALVRKVTVVAREQAARRGIALALSITTNGTLVNDADAAFFSEHGFTVTVSLDGGQTLNDAARPDARGGGSFHQAKRGISRLLAAEGARVMIRATVTPQSGPIVQAVDTLIAMGAHSVGVSPVLKSPEPAMAFSADEIEGLLAEMIACGELARDAVLAGSHYPFSNFLVGLNEIAKGAHRPYPCGAGAGYGSVGADGGLYACHRAIGEPRFGIGDLESGPDPERRADFLAGRHVLRQEPCRSCWARFLCGGGCHHEVVTVGRPACDYVRGWLRFLLASYAEIRALRPEFLAADGPTGAA